MFAVNDGVTYRYSVVPFRFAQTPHQSTSESKAIGNGSIDGAFGETTGCGDHPEWHDAYRLVAIASWSRRGKETCISEYLHQHLLLTRRVVPETQSSQRREIVHPSSERLTWEWGALPIVQPASSDNLSLVDTDTEDELPMMVKSESIYFDAFEGESGPSNTHFAGALADSSLYSCTALFSSHETHKSAIEWYVDHPCMSLCGHLLDEAESQEDVHLIFSEHIVTFEVFREHPIAMLADPNLMFLIDGQICPFNEEVQAYFVSRILFPDSPPLSFGSVASTPSQSEAERIQQSCRAQEDGYDGNRIEERMLSANHTAQRDALLAGENSMRPSSTAHATPRSVQVIPEGNASESFHRKSLHPSQDEILKMGLQFGTNDIEFVVHTAAEEELRVSAKMYFWPISAKIVIAEIDGAVSRIASSGRFSNLLSSKEKERSGLHHGALDFYSKLARNGYRIVYLTCRGLSQADLMHEMLHSSSEAGLALPNGPVLLAPDRLLATNSNEMIDARDFKVAALNGIRALFPSDVNPFYAAFGRTFADSVVFTQVGVFPGKVFLVDEGDGRLRHKSMMNFQESYSSLIAMLDKMFPPICSLSPRHTPSTWKRGHSSLPVPPQHDQRIEPSGMKRIYSATEDLVSEVISSQVRTRSMGDEAYNDLNFWKIRPGRI